MKDFGREAILEEWWKNQLNTKSDFQ